MKDKLSSFERRIEILFWLTKQRKSSFVELADTFSVTTRTIYNDIVFLSRYAPIYTKHGMNGGVYLIDGYRRELFLYLSDSEEKLLRKIMNYLDETERHIISNIINKYSMPDIGT